MKRLLVALSSVALLAGCATVPSSGPIRSGSQDGLAPARPAVAVEAQKPRENVDQVAIVNGYLEAMSDSRAFDVAREYMTADAAAKWHPERTISVYDQASTKAVSRLTDRTVQLSAPLIGTIDERGSWTPAAEGQRIEFVFKLAKVAGQWRVENAPEGVFLGSNQLESRLELRYLYFLSPSRDMLVPDPVYQPWIASPGQSATLLMQELLKGPTSRLGNGVTSAAPPGTQVNVSVPVDYGVATVALSDAAAALGDQDRQKLAAQIAWTLYPISTRVRITVGGAPLLPDEPDELQFSMFSQYDPSVPSGQLRQLYAVRNKKIAVVSGLDGSQTIDSIPLDNGILYGYEADSFAVSLRGEFGAIVTHAGVNGPPIVAYGRLSTRDKSDKVQAIPTEGRVLRPTFDAQDRLWIVDRADNPRPRLRVRTQDGKVAEVVTDFQGASPTVFRIAPDGVRALMLVRRGGTTSVQTGTIATDDAKRLALGRIRPLQLPLQDITDASWYKPDEILVVGSSGKGLNRQPWEVKVDGSKPRLVVGAASLDTVAVAASPNLDTQPVVRDQKGNLYWQSKDLTWLPVFKDAPRDNQAVYPG